MDTTGPRGFQDLLRRAQDGDRGAMDQVLEILRPQLERLARPYADPSRPAASTADLLQEACLRAWQKVGSFEGADSDESTFAMFRVWIGQIVRHLGIQQSRTLKSQRRRPPGGVGRLQAKTPGESTVSVEVPDPRGPTPSAYASAGELALEVEAALKGMPAEEASIVRMHLYEDLKLSEISHRLGLGYHATRDRYLSALRRLEHKLGGWI